MRPPAGEGPFDFPLDFARGFGKTGQVRDHTVRSVPMFRAEHFAHSAMRLLATRWGSIMGGMNLGFPEMIFIFLLALIIFGPKKLPEIGRQIGRALNEFKRASNEFKSQIESEINNLDVENQRQTILPPSPSPSMPPAGSVAASSKPDVIVTAQTASEISQETTPEPSPELNVASKAPDA